MSTTAWVSCMPEDDVESFTERSDERSQVFKDAATRLPTGQLFPLVWAFLQVANLEQVKELTKNRFSWMALAGSKFGSGIEYRAKDAVLLWKQRSGDKDMTKQNTTPASSKRSRSVAFSDHPAPSPLGSVNSDLTSPASATKTRSKKPLGGPEYKPRRGRKVAERCKERDNGLCVVSKVSAVDACHIYPWCAFGGKDQGRVESFWDILQMFWPEDKVNAWRAKLFRDDRHNELKGTETVENMLTLTSTLHRFHSGGAFALRPVRISDDKTQLELEFHWLARHEGNSTRKVDLLEEPLSSRDRKDSGSGYQFCRFGNSNPILLVSGTRFMMTTDDAINKPLPDPGLLELQWHLQRILAMSGAAGWKEEDFDHEDPGTSVVAVPSVEQWLDNQPAEYLQSRGSSPSSSAEVVDGAYE